jgi:hypothetical protein
MSLFFVTITGEREIKIFGGAFILWNEMDGWVKCFVRLPI